jgi:RNA polymerase sigma-70 factor (ECF subfamily)
MNPNAMSDEELVEAGVRAIYERYAPYVAKVAMHVLGRSDDVEDIVQEVFIEVHRSLDSLEAAGALKSWLATIAVRKVHRKLRKKRLPMMRVVTEADQQMVERVPARGISSEDWITLQNILRVLQNDVEPEERIAWALRHVSGFSMKEIAEYCDCSVRTAHRRIDRAEEVLEKEFRHE